MKKNQNQTIAGSVRRLTLDNGLNIFVCPRPGTGTVFASAVIRTGSIHEGKDLGCGLSHFLEHMVFAGTKSFPGHTQIADTVSQAGGYLNARTGYDYTEYYVDMPAGAADQAVDMVYSMVAEPLFPADCFEREKNVILREVGMYADNAASTLFFRTLEDAFQIHPIRIPEFGYAEKIKEVDREMMAAYYALRYSPGRAAIVVAGDVDADRIMERIAGKACTWAMGRVDDPVLPVEPEQHAARHSEFYFRDPLASVMTAFRGVPLNDPDYPAFYVACNLLAGLEGSLLNRRICLENPLADTVGGHVMNVADLSVMYLMTEMQPGNAGKVCDAIGSVINDIRNGAFTQKEMDAVVTGMETAYWRSMRRNASFANLVVSSFVRRRPLEVLDSMPARMAAVTREDVMRVLSRVADDTKLTAVTRLPEEMRPAAVKSVKKKSSAMPVPVLREMKGGQKLVIHPDHAMPLVQVRFILPAGEHYENAKNCGISEVLSDVLLCGTKTYSENEFNELQDCYGIHLDTSAEKDRFEVFGECLAKHLPVLKKLLVSMFTEPLFKADAVARERDACIRILESDLCEPVNSALMLCRKTIFGNTVFGLTDPDRIANMKTLTPARLRAYYARIFDPARTVATIGGDITEKAGTAFLQDVLNSISWTDNPLTAPAEAVFEPGVRNAVEVLEGKAQAAVICALPAPVTGKMKLVHKMMAGITQGMASRVFKEVREVRGLAYHASQVWAFNQYCGYTAYLAATHSGAEAEVLRVFEEIRADRAKNGFSKEEFAMAKAKFISKLAHETEDPVSLAGLAGRRVFYGESVTAIADELKNLEKVTFSEFNKAAKAVYSAPSRVQIVASPEKFSDFPEISH